MLETNLCLPVVHVVSCFYNDFLACGGRSVTMCFSRKERKDRKGVGMGRRVSARPLAAPSGFALSRSGNPTPAGAGE